MDNLTADTKTFTDWTTATANLPWGAQRVLLETLKAVADEQSTLVHGHDYKDGSPCLINAAATMLSAVNGAGGNGKPSAYFGEVVSAFDAVNSLLVTRKVNKGDGYVSPLAAEFLIHNFGTLKDQPVDGPKDPVHPDEDSNPFNITPECSDDELVMDWLTAAKAPVDVVDEDPERDAFVKQEVENFNKLQEAGLLNDWTLPE